MMEQVGRGILVLQMGLSLIFSPPYAESYKIRRSDCMINDTRDSVMHCTCSGVGDPFSIILNKGPKPELGVPYYGTRFGHNLAQQIKQAMVDNNITRVTTVYYEDCPDYPLRVKIDFKDFPLDSYFQKDLTDVSTIVFTRLHSVNLYLRNDLSWGNLTIRFHNIREINDFGYGKNGSVIIYGQVEYCDNPCDKIQPTAGEIREEKTCNDCDTESTLALTFQSVESVLFQDLILTPQNFHGHCSVQADQVGSFSVEGGRYGDVNIDVQADRCFGWKEETNCTSMFVLGGVLEEQEGVAGVVIGAVAIILVFIAVVGAVAGSRLKSGSVS